MSFPYKDIAIARFSQEFHIETLLKVFPFIKIVYWRLKLEIIA